MTAKTKARLDEADVTLTLVRKEHDERVMAEHVARERWASLHKLRGKVPCNPVEASTALTLEKDLSDAQEAHSAATEAREATEKILSQVQSARDAAHAAHRAAVLIETRPTTDRKIAECVEALRAWTERYNEVRKEAADLGLPTYGTVWGKQFMDVFSAANITVTSFGAGK